MEVVYKSHQNQFVKDVVAPTSSIIIRNQFLEVGIELPSETLRLVGERCLNKVINKKWSLNGS
jgi:hypothetical protein